MKALAPSPQIIALAIASYAALGALFWFYRDAAFSRAFTDPVLLFAMAASAPLYAIGVFVAGLRSAFVLDVKRDHRGDVICGIFLALGLNSVLPFRLGDAARLAFLKGRNDVPVIVGVSATAIEKAADLAIIGVAAALAGAIGLLTVIRLDNMGNAVLAVSLLFLFTGFTAAVFWRVGMRLPRIASAAENIRIMLRHVAEPAFWRRGGGTIIALTLIAWALNYVATVVFVLVAAPALNATAIGLLLLVGTNLAFAVPVTPGAIGVFQAVCAAILTAAGVSMDAALAQGICLQIAMLGPSVVLMFPILVRLSLSSRRGRRS